MLSVTLPSVPCVNAFCYRHSVLCIRNLSLFFSFLCYCSFLPLFSTCWIIHVGILGIIKEGICADIWSALQYETRLLIVYAQRSISTYLRQFIKARWKPVSHSCHSKQEPRLKQMKTRLAVELWIYCSMFILFWGGGNMWHRYQFTLFCIILLCLEAGRQKYLKITPCR